MSKPKIVVFTGAGISAESGLKTFRNSNGLWEKYKVDDIATPEGFKRNPKLILDFYNQRRIDVLNCQPNAAHKILAELEQYYDVTVITQNIDDLHERGGSTKVLHLHGEITKMRSSINKYLSYHYVNDITLGDLADDGSQLRPDIVWFGEDVPNMNNALTLSLQADVLVVIGSSLQVYPAAFIIEYTKPGVPIFVIDKNEVEIEQPDIKKRVTFIKKPATKGVKILQKKLNEFFNG